MSSPTRPTAINRRDWLRAAGGGALGLGLRGCCCGDSCKKGPGFPGPTNLATVAIDVHCHVFNAADLPVSTFVLGTQTSFPLETFLSKNPSLARYAGVVVFGLGNLLLSSAADDQKELRFFAGGVSPGQDPLALWDSSVGGFLADLLADEPPAGPRPWAPTFPMELEPQRRALGAQLRAELGGRAPDLQPPSGGDPDLQALPALDSVVQKLGPLLAWCRGLCDYRIRNVDRLFELFGPERLGTGVITPAMIDFHRWLPDVADPAPDAAPRIPLDRQVTVMEQIVRIRPGVHPFLAVDPLADWNDTRALLERCFGPDGDPDSGNGFIGVKLYPPMGFAPLGNDHLAAVDRGLPARVDGNLRSLYGYCVAHDVPIMSHCNASNDTVTARAASTYSATKWAAALAEFPSLRVNLAHFSGLHGFADAVAAGMPTPEQDAIGALMEAPGSRVYSDFADETTVRDPAFRQELAAALGSFLGPSSSVRRGRIMYGSDWNMLGIEEGFPTYLEDWVEAMRLATATIPPVLGEADVAGFFGGNALGFLGLAEDTHGRRRLLRFYADAFGTVPGWLPALPEGGVGP